MRTRNSTLALVTLVAFVALVVSPPSARADEGDELAAAKQRFDAGRTAYLSGDYRQALAEFQAAQELRPSPILDYNIGLCHEALGEREQAYAAYQRYLTDKPDAANRSEVERRMAAIAQQLQRTNPRAAAPAREAPQRAPRASPPSDPATAPKVAAPAAPSVPSGKKSSNWWIVFPIVGGVLTIGLFVGLAVAVAGASSPNYLEQPVTASGGAAFRF